MHSPYRIIHKKFLFINDLIPHSASFNMEFDQWLFRLREQERVENVLRLYEWERPSITYGRFQAIVRQVDMEQCRKDNVPLVQRPTGGRAILHWNELTFSLVMGPESIEPYGFRNCFLFTAELVRDSLSKLGIKAKINLEPHKYENKTLCFQSVSQYEIVDRNRSKLAGIAQHFTSKGVLVQGSIPLKENKEHGKYFKGDRIMRFTNELMDLGVSAERMRRVIEKTAEEQLEIKSCF